MSKMRFALRNRQDRPHLIRLPLTNTWHAESKWASACGETIQEAYMNWKMRDAEVQAMRAAQGRRARKK